MGKLDFTESYPFLLVPGESTVERSSMPTLSLTQRSLPKPQRKEEKLAVCSGSVSLAPEDRAELLAILATDEDSAIAERAQNALLSQSMESFLKALDRADSDPALFRYCSENLGSKLGIADALARNIGCPTSQVTSISEHLTTAGVQALLDNLERFCEDQRLVEAVLQSSVPSAEQRALIDELKKGAMSTAEIEEIVGDFEPDAQKRETLLQRVAHMGVVQRLTLALKGGRSERLMLIRDPNKLIQRGVLQSPRLTDTEVEAFAAMSNLSVEVLRAISMMRIFMKNYTVARNLVNNPKTPLDVSLHLFPRLTSTDLVKLTTNKNVPETLRSSAVKLQRKRKTGSS
jgi:hypothetical protein